MKLLKFGQIRIDGNTQMRVSIDQDKVREYAEKMREGEEFAPVLTMFDGTDHWLVDGFHRYFAAQAAGFKDLPVIYKPGTQEDAQDAALSANEGHGKPRTNEDRRKAVEFAIAQERHADKSDREIAKLCKVSHTFVASIRNPEAKERQIKNRKTHALKESGVDSTGVDSTLKPGDTVQSGVDSTQEPKLSMTQDYGPDAEELKAMELAEQADREMLNKMLESDDALKVAVEENKRLNFLIAQQDVRIAALMNEKNAAVKQIKSLESQLKKAKK